MEYRYLGKSGIKVSNICLGTLTFGRLWPPPGRSCDEDLSHQIMDRYVELGGNFLDTADIYNSGVSEEIIGRWIEKRERDSVVVATKVGLRWKNETDMNKVGLSRRYITGSIDRSLERLHTDYVDLYQTHVWDEGTCVEETLRTLDDLVRCGKVRYIGFSNLRGWQMQKVFDVCKYLGLNSVVSLQQEYSLVSRWSEQESFQVCKMEGIGVLPWSPLKGGLLTGKYKRNAKPSDGRLAYVALDEKARSTPSGPAWSKLNDSVFDIVEAVESFAKKKGKSPAQVSLKWVLQKDVVSSIIIGATSIEQLEHNIDVSSGWTLSPEEMKQLDEVSNPGEPYPYDFISEANKTRSNSFSPAQFVSNTF